MGNLITFIYEQNYYGCGLYNFFHGELFGGILIGVIFTFLSAVYMKKKKITKQKTIFNQIILLSSILLIGSILFTKNILLSEKILFSGIFAGILPSSYILYFYHSSENKSDFYRKISLAASIVLVFGFFAWCFGVAHGYRACEIESSITKAEAPMVRLKYLNFPELNRKNYSDYFDVMVALQNINEYKKGNFISLKDKDYLKTKIVRLKEFENKIPTQDDFHRFCTGGKVQKAPNAVGRIEFGL